VPRDELLEPRLNGQDTVHDAVDDVAVALAYERAIRPRTMSEFVGQAELKEQLGIILEAARGRGRSADHLLFAGPPGLGKTTLACIVAAELGAHLHITSGPAIERAGDLASILTNLSPGDVLFIDEIHRLPRPVEEVLYPAMEDRQIDVVLGKGPAARSIRFELEAFTLVGATTRTGLITGPLRDRFGFAFRLDYYNTADLEQIVLRAAEVLEVTIDVGGAAEIARRSRGTPRIANRLLRRVRDYAEVRGNGVINDASAADGLLAFGIDERGLDKVDQQLLANLCRHFEGGPVGLSNLAISVGEPAETVEDVIEPFLIQQGLLVRTSRGRVATSAAWRHIGLEPPAAPGPGPGPTEEPPSLFS
jgi:holliday junction DNA helicase RuvB